MKKLIILGIAFLGFISLNAQDGFHKHDGFYLSLAGGPSAGTISMEGSQNGNSATGSYKGSGGALDIQIGGAIKENLILHANLTSLAITGPTVTLNGVSAKFPNESSIGQAMFGVGLTYYIMPANIFFTANIGSGNFTVTDNGKSTSTDHGGAFQIKIGKEWWVSKNWGLGVSAILNTIRVSNNPTTGGTEKISGAQFGVLFNATFN